MGERAPADNRQRRASVALRLQAASFRFLHKIGVDVLPLDKDLASRFERNSTIFGEVRDMLELDSHLGYVSQTRTRLIGEGSWRPPDSPGISPGRWAQYRTLLRQVGVSATSGFGAAITMRVASTGAATKGYVYMPHEKVLVASLDDFPLPPERHAHRLLADSWHLYLSWE